MGKGRFHCHGDDGREERRIRKLCAKANWFRKPGNKDREVGLDRTGNRDDSPKNGKVADVLEKKKVVMKEVRIASPLFVPATKDGTLVAKLKKEEGMMGELFGWRYTIVERSGTMLRDLLTKANPFEKEDCQREGCAAC